MCLTRFFFFFVRQVKLQKCFSRFFKKRKQLTDPCQVKFILPERQIKIERRIRRKTLRSSESAAPSAATYNYQTAGRLQCKELKTQRRKYKILKFALI